MRLEVEWDFVELGHIFLQVKPRGEKRQLLYVHAGLKRRFHRCWGETRRSTHIYSDIDDPLWNGLIQQHGLGLAARIST